MMNDTTDSHINSVVSKAQYRSTPEQSAPMILNRKLIKVVLTMASEFDAECQTAMGVVPMIPAARKHRFDVIERIELELPAVDQIGPDREIDAPIIGCMLHVLYDRLLVLILNTNAVEILAAIVRRTDTDLDPSEFLGKRGDHAAQADTCPVQIGRCAVFAHIGMYFGRDREIGVDRSAIFYRQRRSDPEPVVVDTAADIDAGTYADRVSVLRREAPRKKQWKEQEEQLSCFHYDSILISRININGSTSWVSPTTL